MQNIENGERIFENCTIKLAVPEDHMSKMVSWCPIEVLIYLFIVLGNFFEIFFKLYN